MQDMSEGEGFLHQQQTRRELTKKRALFEYTKALLLPKRQQKQPTDPDEKPRDDDEEFNEVVFHDDKPRRPWRNLQLRTFITSLTGLILTILSFVFGVGCGLGIGIPYYGGSSLSHAFSRPSSHNGIPDDLPIISAAQLTNRTELDLETRFTFSESPQARDYDFTISLGLAAPDGFWKPMVLVNGRSPGPLIEAATGDTVRVRVTNLLPNASTSMHFHGIDQRGTPWMDGVSGVTQCGIPPGESWTYEFVLAGQRGTFWYHAHAAVQYTDGLYGPIVVHGPDEMVAPSDAERIVFLGENHHAYAGELAAHYLAASSPWEPAEAGVEPLSDNLLLNGQNTFDCSVVSTTFNSTFRQKDTPACTGGQVYATSIRPGTTMRLRLINHSSYLSYWFSIDKHPLTVVEIDGVEVEPIVSQGVHVNIGQRYSVIISATQKVGDYAIRSALEKECFLPYSTYTSSGLESVGYQVKGTLIYERDEEAGGDGTKGEEDTEEEVGQQEGETTNPWGCGDMQFDMPKPLRQEAAYELGEGDPTHIVDFQFRQVGEINRIFLNKVSYTSNSGRQPLRLTHDRTNLTVEIIRPPGAPTKTTQPFGRPQTTTASSQTQLQAAAAAVCTTTGGSAWTSRSSWSRTAAGPRRWPSTASTPWSTRSTCTATACRSWAGAPGGTTLLLLPPLDYRQRRRQQRRHGTWTTRCAVTPSPSPPSPTSSSVSGPTTRESGSCTATSHGTSRPGCWFRSWSGRLT